MLTVTKIEEAGHRSAMIGLAKSKKQPLNNMPSLARKLAFMDGGHNKFLEAMFVWLDVRGPRYWWQEADTFRLSTKQSESTMHTLVEELRELGTIHYKKYCDANFEPDSCSLQQFEELLYACQSNDIVKIKAKLPEGFLQSRLWVLSYKTLRNIILQRRTHRLPHWHEFIEQVLEQVNCPEFLPDGRVIS